MEEPVTIKRTDASTKTKDDRVTAEGRRRPPDQKKRTDERTVSAVAGATGAIGESNNRTPPGEAKKEGAGARPTTQGKERRAENRGGPTGKERGHGTGRKGKAGRRGTEESKIQEARNGTIGNAHKRTGKKALERNKEGKGKCATVIKKKDNNQGKGKRGKGLKVKRKTCRTDNQVVLFLPHNAAIVAAHGPTFLHQDAAAAHCLPHAAHGLPHEAAA
nr:hypothetical protein Iba_chr12cCG11970 [Ipomoea batatas]